MSWCILEEAPTAPEPMTASKSPTANGVGFPVAGTVYPDFTFLSEKTGKEIYWEHEGMMDKQEYARTAVRKIESYQKNDIYPGDHLILTFETEQSVLNSKTIEGLVNKYL